MFEGQADPQLQKLVTELDQLYGATKPPKRLEYFDPDKLAQKSKPLISNNTGNLKPRRAGALISKIVIVFILLGLIVGALTVPWLNSFFLGCFVFGLVFTLASFLIGGLDHVSGLHIGADHGGSLTHHVHVEVGHGDVGHGGHAAPIIVHNQPITTPHGNSEAGGLSWLNFNALILFVTWFGAAGFVITQLGLSSFVALPIALVSGIVGYALIMLFLSKVLYASQTPLMREQDYDLTGTVARVSSTIFANGIGEIIFNQFDVRRSAPARSHDKQPLARDTKVVVLRYENGIAYVADLNKMLEQ